MKRIAIVVIAAAAAMGTSARAADLPVKAPMVAPPAKWEWTGCYLGIEGGGNFGYTHNHDITAPFVGLPVTDSSDMDGVLGGVTVGCNYQVSQVVIGVEGDVSWTNQRETSNEIAPFNPAATLAVRENWIDTVRGRIGYKLGERDQLLIYATGGGAFAGARVTTEVPGVFTTSATETLSGWTAGAGLELAVGPVPTPHNWVSVKFEYLYVGFPGKDFTLNPALTTSKNVTVNDNIMRVGLNWHF